MTWKNEIEVKSILVEGAQGPSTYDPKTQDWVKSIEKSRTGFFVETTDPEDVFVPIHRVYEADVVDNTSDNE